VYTINYKLNVIIVKLLLFLYICYYYTYFLFIVLTYSISTGYFILPRLIECVRNKQTDRQTNKQTNKHNSQYLTL